MAKRARIAAVAGALGLVATLAPAGITGAQQAPAAPSNPTDALKAAFTRTAAAQTARISVLQRMTVGSQVLQVTGTGTLAGGDHDVTLHGDLGDHHQVAVGTTVYERTPDQPGQPWRTSPRSGSAPAPAASNVFTPALGLLTPSVAHAAANSAFGPLTLPNGTSVADPVLYRSVADGGPQTLPQGSTHKLVGELDMPAVGRAMRLQPTEQARTAQLSATVTVWVGDADGRIARQSLRLTTPAASAGGTTTTVETTTELTDLDAPLSVQAPRG